MTRCVPSYEVKLTCQRVLINGLILPGGWSIALNFTALGVSIISPTESLHLDNI